MHSPINLHRHKVEGVFVQLDPTGKHKGTYSQPALLEGLGMIPHFITEAINSLKTQIMAGYGFPCDSMEGRVNDGIYYSSFQEDEPLVSYGKIFRIEKTMLDVNLLCQRDYAQGALESVEVFPYGIVCFTDADGNQTITRMD